MFGTTALFAYERNVQNDPATIDDIAAEMGRRRTTVICTQVFRAHCITDWECHNIYMGLAGWSFVWEG